MAEKTEVKQTMPETHFTQVQYTLQGLMNQIGLPSIQRPHRLKDSPSDRHVNPQGLDLTREAIDGG